jgi:hypothetical protein
MLPENFTERSPSIIKAPQDPGLSDAPITAMDFGLRKTFKSEVNVIVNSFPISLGYLLLKYGIKGDNSELSLTDVEIA